MSSAEDSQSVEVRVVHGVPELVSLVDPVSSPLDPVSVVDEEPVSVVEEDPVSVVEEESSSEPPPSARPFGATPSRSPSATAHPPIMAMNIEAESKRTVIGR
jgi:hypothetical protein